MNTGLRVALIGYGRMGKELHLLMRERQWPHPLIIDPGVESAASTVAEADLTAVDVCIEFTAPSQAADNIIAALRKGASVVSGSTGWQQRVGEVRRTAEESGGAVLHGSNFSLGVAVFNAVVAHAASLLARFPQYDISLHEIHHRGKKDIPSGTAHMLAESILRAHAGKRRSSLLPESGPFAEDTLYITAARSGTVVGEHVVTADSEADEIRLLHRAKGRRGFAEGALAAAEWLQGKTGYFTLEDMIDDIITA
ncbi:MAG: 4-hydroxy-tetrahydrodipicolinate reductase [Bacteroidota bacterium]|nr:4-hydroxy-tetrahydrodipicolinate reductase [Bacteroidota bacterium]